jgi:hypothetical protein
MTEQDKQIKLKKYITECVSYLMQQESLLEDIKNLADIAKEELDVPPAEFKAIAKAKHKADKTQQQIDKLTAALESANSL